MLSYEFSQRQYKNPISGKEKTEFSMWVRPPYDMVQSIGDIVNDPKYIQDILLNLTNVMEGKLESYGWGCDMALVLSYKDNSVVEYMAEKDGVVGDFQIEIPTQWLYKLMEDWKKYLEENLK